MLDVQCSMFDVHSFIYRFDWPFLVACGGATLKYMKFYLQVLELREVLLRQFFVEGLPDRPAPHEFLTVFFAKQAVLIFAAA